MSNDKMRALLEECLEILQAENWRGDLQDDIWAALTRQPESRPPSLGGVIVTDAQMHEFRQRYRHAGPAIAEPLTQQPESELKGTVGNCCGPDNRGLYRVSVFSGSPFPVGTTVCASPQPSAQVPDGWHIGIEADGTAIIKMPDGGGVCVSSSENEIARIVLRQLAEALLAGPSAAEKESNDE